MKFTGERFIPGEYDETLMGLEHWQRYIAAKKLVKGKIVLDIACGEGYGANFMAEDAKFVYGIDICEEAIKHASSKYEKSNLSFKCGSIEKLDIEDKSIDIIVCFETIEHVDHEIQKAFLQETKRVLKDDGILIISSPNKAIATDFAWKVWRYRNEFHVKEFYIEEFFQFLSSYFKCLKFFYQRNETALILNSESADSLEIILNNGKGYANTQNIIAVCSDAEIDYVRLDSIALEKSNLYQTNNMIIEDLKKHTSNLQNLNLEIQDKNTELQNEIIELRTKNIMLQNENIELQNKYTELQNEIIELQTKNIMLQSENIELQSKNSKLQDENTDLRGQYINLQSEKSELQVQNEYLSSKEVELLKIYNSRGWKLLNILYKIKSKIIK